jgi:hypothetical protein
LEKVSRQGSPGSWAKAGVLFADVLLILFDLTLAGRVLFLFFLSNLQDFWKS